MTKQGFAWLPGRGDAGGTELAERLLASQEKFAQDTPCATAPLLPGKGGTGAKNSGGQTRQASPSRRACPLPVTGPRPGGEPVAVRRRLAYHPEQGAKARNYGATVIGAWSAQTQILGAFIRNRRKLARLSLRQLAAMTSLSNPYLSQLERGMHVPSVRVLKLLSEALNVSVETLLAQAGLLDLAPSGDGAAAADGPPASPVESAISAEERLADEQKAALIAVYRSMLRS
jgi:transcriptional regulator with XRE-family HTH domain